MKQTAVEWFFSELERMQYFIGNDMLEALKQAKKIEELKTQSFALYYAMHLQKNGGELLSVEELFEQFKNK